MAEVRPLRAVRYDCAQVPDLGAVLAPPYDVISPELREELYRRDPHNIVRIDYGHDQPDDVPGSSDRYTRAAAQLAAWSREGLLRRDAQPALYVHEHGFQTDEGRQRMRRGLFARVRALPWEESDVLPHERTLRGPKQDRLALLRATRAQTSAALVVWDRAGGLGDLLADAVAAPPDLDAESPGEVAAEQHRLWVVDDPRAVENVLAALRGARLYMADGHHRFETAAAYAAERRRTTAGAAGAPADFDWTLVHLCGADDPALLVLPTHRLVRPGAGVPNRLGDLLARLPARFAVERQRDLASAARAAAARRDEGHAIAVAARDGAALLLAAHDTGASPRARLDVSVVEDEILAGGCGLDAQRIAGGALTFARRVAEAADAVAEGRAALAICLNGCTTAEIIAVSDAGEQMPQKSTYFYPKVPTGLVLSPV